MSGIIINEQLCIGCGQCASDCVSEHINIVDGKAYVKEGRCIECGHCYAICPAEAVTMDGYDCSNLGKLKPLTDFDSDELMLAMKSRRSVRRFTSQPVSQEDVLKIIEAGRYCPTGSNAQNVHFIVLDKSKDACEAAAVSLFKRVQKSANFFYPALKDREISDSFFFKGAPLIILTAAKRDIDAGLASSYMELMAASMGLGVFYSGFFVFAAAHSKEIKATLDLPDGLNVVSCLCIGHSDVEYQRIPPRKAANLILR